MKKLLAGKKEAYYNVDNETYEMIEELRKRISEEKDIELLTKWLREAARAGSIEEFTEKM